MKTLSFIFRFIISAVAIFLTAFTFGADAETAAVVGGAGAAALSKIKTPQGALGAYVGVGNMSDGSTGIQVISSERERAVYEHNKARFGNKEMVPGYLRLEATIKNSTNILSFKTFEGDGATVYATERRLDRNDAFIATECGLFLLRQDVALGKTNGHLQTYPNLTVFAAVAGFVPADLFAIYQGYLTFTVSREKKLVAFDTQRFLHIPETQQSGATNYDQRKYKDGFHKLTPQIVLFGNGTNELELTFPSYAGWNGASVTAGVEHRIVLYLRGLFVSGGAK